MALASNQSISLLRSMAMSYATFDLKKAISTKNWRYFMQVTDIAVSFNVKDVAVSSQFLQRHFGFEEKMSTEGFASLRRADCAMSVILLQLGIEQLPESFRHEKSQGVILALTVTDIAAEARRIEAEGLEFTLPLREEAWGEKLFQVTDPNGLLVQLVEWAE